MLELEGDGATEGRAQEVEEMAICEREEDNWHGNAGGVSTGDFEGRHRYVQPLKRDNVVYPSINMTLLTF